MLVVWLWCLEPVNRFVLPSQEHRTILLADHVASSCPSSYEAEESLMDLIRVQAGWQVKIEDIGVAPHCLYVPPARDRDPKATVDDVASTLLDTDSEVGTGKILWFAVGVLADTVNHTIGLESLELYVDAALHLAPKAATIVTPPFTGEATYFLQKGLLSVSPQYVNFSLLSTCGSVDYVLETAAPK